MVFVLGILTLLGIVGLVLIARTHGDARSVELQQASQTADATMDSVIRGVQETLWRDIWGPAPETVDPRPLDANRQRVTGAPAVLEDNEAFDAPGENDRWLSSLLPHPVIDETPGSPTVGLSVPVTTWSGISAPPVGYPVLEDNVLAWRYVSYVGTDLLVNDAQRPFGWASNSRRENGPRVIYSASNLENVQVLQTPPPAAWAAGLPMVPGSTTNVTIAEARELWFDATHQANLAARFPGLSPRFPYFDTNADGRVDLYDADGDGIPDSPLSLVIPVHSSDPNAPRNLYAAVRVVDHGGMMNVNVASSIIDPSFNAVFDESLQWLQRRGQRRTELLLDEVVHPIDGFLGADRRAARLVNYRNNGLIQDPEPLAYDVNVARTLLAGGSLRLVPPAVPPLLYGINDEAALRHRSSIVPYQRRREATRAGYETLDRALPATLQWARQVDPQNGYDYVRPNGTSRWTRFNAQWGDPQGLYEGNDAAANVMGWRSLMRSDEPYAIRRPLVTTISHHVPKPVDVRFGLATTEDRLAQLRNLGMDWPVLNAPRFPQNPTISDLFEDVGESVPEWLRPQRIDLHMSSPSDPVGAKMDFVRYAAAAMYLALSGVSSVQGIPVENDGNTADDESLNRLWLAWQFAVNLADYRDSDDEPTIVEWVSGHRVYGVERQPFLTEAYAHVIAGQPRSGPGPSNLPGDRWFFAVELFVPAYWNLSTDRLYIRTNFSSQLIPLSSFTRVNDGAAPLLQGGTAGRYIVLCGATNDAPTGLNILPFHRNAGFRMTTDGFGRTELVYSATGVPGDPTEHILDSIGPKFAHEGAAESLEDFRTTASAEGRWARNLGLAADQRLQFSLARSTKGWRFTTAWHRYAESPPAFGPGPQNLPHWLGPNLGAPNRASQNLDKFIPESVWPARAPANGVFPPLDSFASRVPNRDFDSVADLSRMFIVGAARRPSLTSPPYLKTPDGAFSTSLEMSLSDVLANITAAEFVSAPGSGGDMPSSDLERLAVGRIDFRDAIQAGGRPWTHRLADFFTTDCMIFDGVDNDGNGLADLADPAEGARLLNRVAGAINMNTAPVAVLRGVPYMSMLPSSAEFLFRVTTGVNPATDFENPANADLFWDMATAVVSRREGRAVALRLWEQAMLPNGGMRRVAVARRGVGMGRPGPIEEGPYANFFELSNLRHIRDVTDAVVVQHEGAFRIDRFSFDPARPGLALVNHRISPADPAAGPASPISPDFRTRRLDNDGDWNFDTAQGDDFMMEFVPIQPVGQIESGGIRARDVLLARAANLMTVRSDVFTVYVALIDENGHYVRRGQFTLDRSDCFRSPPQGSRPGAAILPRILTREVGAYAEDVR